jgi:FkbM family methyltransferase
VEEALNLVIQNLANQIKDYEPEIQFKALEIGALRLGEEEKFHAILKYFPGSAVIGFEVDAAVCEEMNATSEAGMTYFPQALGTKNENKTFYETNAPMCGSLFKPNEPLLRLYHNFEVAYLKKETTIDTNSLDSFLEKNSMRDMDFIKIDVQGAEVDIFAGAAKTLKDVTFIVSEAMFIEHYENQPLFGDVCNSLKKHNLMFHKFLGGMGGRTLKPALINNDPNYASQHIWSDVVFITNVLNIRTLSSSKLLKLSFFAALYDSFDVTLFALNHHDAIYDTSFVEIIFGKEFIKIPINT